MMIGARELVSTVIGTAWSRIVWYRKDINNIYDRKLNIFLLVNNERNFHTQIWIDKMVLKQLQHFTLQQILPGGPVRVIGSNRLK